MELKTYDFDSDNCELVGVEKHGKNWPVVYLIHNDTSMYIGETNSFQNRFRQHLDNPNRKQLTTISFVDDDEFNKSAVLDIEQGLIRLCGADGKFRLQNRNAGQSGMHDYFERARYERKIPEIWNGLRDLKLANQSYDDLVNSNLFKYSPYTTLTTEQNEVCYDVMCHILRILGSGESGTSVINGSAGTGKTIVAIKLVDLLLNIASDEVSYEDDSWRESDAREEKGKWQKLISEWREYVKGNGKPKIAFVVPMESLRETLKQVFDGFGGRKMAAVVTSPSGVVLGRGSTLKEKFDVIVVDESHRLKKRKALSGGPDYTRFDTCCEKLGMRPETSNQLDWIVAQSRHRVLFYDSSQSVKPSDVSRLEYSEAISRTLTETFSLRSQMRCKGGDDFLEYVKDVFDEDARPQKKRDFGDYDIRVFDDVGAMVQAIKERDAEKGLSRVVAGYSWYWATKGKRVDEIKQNGLFDIAIGPYRYCWNTTQKGWILSPNAINEIGCVHTTQGYDLNYVGLIFGKEIDYDERSGKFRLDDNEFYDRNVKYGSTQEQMCIRILNAYKVMMTRGIYGCYMYACNPGMQKFLKKWFPSASGSA